MRWEALTIQVKCTVSKINFSTQLISKNVEYCEALSFMPTNLRFVLSLKVFIYFTGLLDTLNDMNLKLEEIQKSLDMYLETKRQIFPRFYFLSNDDLLEILGQSKNPEAVSSIVETFDWVDLLCLP